MKSTVYIETSIPSFYHETRKEHSAIARRDWTREWWENYRDQYHVVSSVAVIEELEDGEYDKKTKCLEFLNEISLLKMSLLRKVRQLTI
ncbi:hypothetical protein WDW89_22775 [Deltaproteobacteria bacterium TL4]